LYLIQLPAHLIEKLKDNKNKQIEREEELNTKTIYVATELHFRQHFGTDLVLAENAVSLRVRKNETGYKLYSLVSQSFNVPLHRMRLWTFIRRKNKTLRPDDIISSDYRPVMNYVIENLDPSVPVIFYLEISDAPDDEAMELPGFEYFPKRTTKQRTAIIFFKCYYPETSSCVYVGKLHVPINSVIYDWTPYIKQISNIPESSSISIWEEIKHERLDEVNLYKTFLQAELKDGDLLIVQELTPVMYQYPLPTALLYFKQLFSIYKIVFKCKNDEKETFKEEMKITVTHNVLREKIAKHIQANPEHIRLSGTEWKPSTKSSENEKVPLKEITFARRQTQGSEPLIVYYEVFSFPVEKLRKMSLLRVKYRQANTDVLEDSQATLLLPKKEVTCSKVITAFMDQNTVKTEISTKKTEFRLIAVQDGFIKQVFNSNQEIPKSYHTHHDLFIEEIPEEEKQFLEVCPSISATEENNNAKPPSPAKQYTDFINTKNQDQRVQCIHIMISQFDYKTTPTGNPFYMVIKKGETLKEFKERICSKLDLKKTILTNWKFYKIRTNGKRDDRKILLEKDVLSDRNFNENRKGPAFFGMDHPPVNREEVQEKIIRL